MFSAFLDTISTTNSHKVLCVLDLPISVPPREYRPVYHAVTMASSHDSWILPTKNPWQASDAVFNPSFVLTMNVYSTFLRHDYKSEESLWRCHFKALGVWPLVHTTGNLVEKSTVSVSKPRESSGIVGWFPHWCCCKGLSDPSCQLPLCVCS